jgi:hypothetical protein
MYVVHIVEIHFFSLHRSLCSLPAALVCMKPRLPHAHKNCFSRSRSSPSTRVCVGVMGLVVVPSHTNPVTNVSQQPTGWIPPIVLWLFCSAHYFIVTRMLIDRVHNHSSATTMYLLFVPLGTSQININHHKNIIFILYSL